MKNATGGDLMSFDKNPGKIVILEGLDNCGKSTLIRHFRKYDPNPKTIALASTSPPKQMLLSNTEWTKQHYESILGEMVSLGARGFDVFADRCHCGETVYSPLYRNTKADYIWDIEKKLCYNNPNIFLITIIDSGKNIAARDDGLSNESSIEQFDASRELFIEAHNKSCIVNKKLHDVEKDGWADFSQYFKWVFGNRKTYE